MTAKQVLFRAAAREKVLHGATQLADAVADRMRHAAGNVGFDAARKEFVDLFEVGIVDPAKVVRLALENAISVAGVLLLTEATMTEKPEKQDTRHPSPDMGM